MPAEGLIIEDTGISFRKMADLLRDGAVKAAIGFNSNLIMSVPESREGGKWDEMLKSEDFFYVHVGPAKSEMAAYADVILPACTYLEDWGYESAIPGSGYAEARIKQPVLDEPLHDSRPTASIIFDIAGRLGKAAAFTPISGSSETFAQDFAKYRVAGLMIGWDDFRKAGVWKESPAYSYGTYAFDTDSHEFEFHSEHLERLLNVRLPGEGTDYPLALAIYRPVLEIRSGSQNYPWAQEMYLVMHGRGWRNLLEINRETAHEHGIGEGDEVVVESPYGEIEGEARVVEGMRPAWWPWPPDRGITLLADSPMAWDVSPTDAIATEYDEESGQPSFFGTRERSARREAVMANWAMVIDLDKCVGCQACSLACKAENNVPHGSPYEHKRHQDIFWHKVIAVSEGEYPSVNTQIIPMPCMHCDHPPCVNVCPSKATYKRDDGIVMQNFRRCLGCRYCIVACPYGARSFNFKDQQNEECPASRSPA